jgi:hypothetical protein
MIILFRRGDGTVVIFIEMKSIRGRISPAQKQMRADVLPTGVIYYMARSAEAALTAVWREGAPFRKAWTQIAVEPWAGPFPDPTLRLPLHPLVTAERREEKQRYRLRKAAREAAPLAAAAAAVAGPAEMTRIAAVGGIAVPPRNISPIPPPAAAVNTATKKPQSTVRHLNPGRDRYRERNRDRHRPGYMAAYMRRRRAAASQAGDLSV